MSLHTAGLARPELCKSREVGLQSNEVETANGMGHGNVPFTDETQDPVSMLWCSLTWYIE